MISSPVIRPNPLARLCLQLFEFVQVQVEHSQLLKSHKELIRDGAAECENPILPEHQLQAVAADFVRVVALNFIFFKF